MTTVLTSLKVKLKREIGTAFQGHSILGNQKNWSEKRRIPSEASEPAWFPKTCCMTDHCFLIFLLNNYATPTPTPQQIYYPCQTGNSFVRISWPWLELGWGINEGQGRGREECLGTENQKDLGWELVVSANPSQGFGRVSDPSCRSSVWRRVGWRGVQELVQAGQGSLWGKQKLGSPWACVSGAQSVFRIPLLVAL